MTQEYEIIIPRRVEKELNKLEDDIIDQIFAKLDALSKNPLIAGSKKLSNRSA